MTDCYLNPRYIVVLNLIDDTKRNTMKNLYVEYKNCRYLNQPDIKYGIVYKEVVFSERDISPLFTVFEKFIEDNMLLLLDVCNTMLVYANHIPFSILKHVLNKLRDVKIKKTLFVYSDRYSEQSISPHDYNIAKLLFNPNIDMYVDWENLTSKSLTCQPWFIYYMTTVFDCGKGRLIQIGSTCYLNVILNAIILSDNLKHVIVKAMNRYAINNPHLVKEIKRPFEDTSACPLLSEKTNTLRTLYIFRALYSVICSGRKIKSDKDLILGASAKYFTSKTYKPADIKRGRGGGFGHSFYVIYTFLYDIGVTFLLQSPLMARDQFVVPEKLSAEQAQQLREKYILPDLENIISTPFPSASIILRFIENNNVIDYFSHYPVACVVKINLMDYSHVVCGFVCDGVYKIFDSNGYIFDIDWRYLYDESIIHEFRRQISQFYNINYENANAYVHFVIYVQKSASINIPVCEF